MSKADIKESVKENGEKKKSQAGPSSSNGQPTADLLPPPERQQTFPMINYQQHSIRPSTNRQQLQQSMTATSDSQPPSKRPKTTSSSSANDNAHQEKRVLMAHQYDIPCMTHTSTGILSTILTAPAADVITNFISLRKMPSDPDMLITTIKCKPKVSVFEFSNGSEREVPHQEAEYAIRRYKAASTLSFKSRYRDVVMFGNYMEAAIHQMNPAFFVFCKEVAFRGLWHATVLKSIIAKLPYTIQALSFRRYAVSGRFLLTNDISIKSLQCIDFDCRNTSDKDFTTNIRNLRIRFHHNQLMAIKLAVTGFPADVTRFKEEEINLQMLLKPGGFASITSDFVLDDYAYEILQECQYTFRGEIEFEETFESYGEGPWTRPYYNFDKKLPGEKTISLKFLKD